MIVRGWIPHSRRVFACDLITGVFEVGIAVDRALLCGFSARVNTNLTLFLLVYESLNGTCSRFVTWYWLVKLVEGALYKKKTDELAGFAYGC